MGEKEGTGRKEGGEGRRGEGKRRGQGNKEREQKMIACFVYILATSIPRAWILVEAVLHSGRSSCRPAPTKHCVKHARSIVLVYAIR